MRVRKKRLVIVLFFFLITTSASSYSSNETVTGSFNTTFFDTVRIDAIASVPSDNSVIRADLDRRYLPFAGQLSFTIYAITPYTVTMSTDITTPTTPGTTFNRDQLLEVGGITFTTSDDGVNNPTVQLATNCGNGVITSTTAESCDDVPDDGTGILTLFTGGNTLTGTTGLTTNLLFRLDKDALGDDLQNNTHTFTVTITITEN